MAVGPRREGGTVGVSALARNTILARGASRRVMTHLWRLLSIKALKGKVTHITGAGTPYGDRLDRAPRPSGRWRRGLAHRARCTLGAPDNVDKAPAWCALSRIRREQLLGQKFQCLPCVATPHQGDQAHEACTKTFWVQGPSPGDQGLCALRGELPASVDAVD